MSYLDALGNKIWANLMELITSCAGLITGCLATSWAHFYRWICSFLAFIPLSSSSWHVPEDYTLANRLLDAMVALPFRDSVYAISILPFLRLCSSVVVAYGVQTPVYASPTLRVFLERWTPLAEEVVVHICTSFWCCAAAPFWMGGF
ncbi:hypothetical protein DFH09DRAFT_1102452 [Mycena vulgaris]|nr:hypothetical protein DFH09DRAFT_1102452 [Mycena vulgaris]